MMLFLAEPRDFESIKPRLRVVNDVSGFSVCDSRGTQLIGGFNDWKQAECTAMSLTTVYEVAKDRNFNRVKLPFHLFDNTERVFSPNASARPGPYWAIEDCRGSHIWGGWRTEEDGQVGLRIVEIVYAAGVAARVTRATEPKEDYQLRLVGAGA